MPARILQFPSPSPTPEEQEKRVQLIALASPGCCRCNGTSVQQGGADCPCAYRAVCRVVVRRWRNAHPTTKPRNTLRGWDLPGVEFSIDVVGVARKALDPPHWDVWQQAVLLEVPWRIGCARTGLDKGTYFHALYTAEARLGRVFMDTLPYELYPIPKYYSTSRREGVTANRPEPAKVIPFRKPLPLLAMKAAA